MCSRQTRRTWLKDLLASGLLISARPSLASEPEVSGTSSDGNEYRRPELVAISWLGEQVRGRKTPPPEFAWRADGLELSQDEIAHLYRETEGFDLTEWRRERTLRPLNLVFRIDERSKWKQGVRASASVGGRTFIGGPFGDSLKNHLAVSAISPLRDQLAEWPAKIDLEVRTQIAEPEMIHRLDEMPQGRIEVDKGVQWSLEPSLGIRRDGTRGFPAAVIWWNRAERNPLNDYEPLMTLKNGKQLERRMVHPDYEISDVIEADNPVVSVEFWRRRFRIDRFENVPTRLDRMPK